MIKFLLGKLDCGRRLIEKLNSLKLESPFKEWAEHSYSEFCDYYWCDKNRVRLEIIK